MKSVIDLLGRIFLSIIFLFEAYDSIAYFNQTKDTMTAYGITWQQDILLGACIFILVLGGIFILIGYRASLGAFLILLYWLPVTFIVHSFWNDPLEIQRLQSILFMKNLAITGGLLMILVNGTGPYSIRRLFSATRLRS